MSDEERLEKIRRLESDIQHMQERFADPFDDGGGDDEEPPQHYRNERYEDGSIYS